MNQYLGIGSGPEMMAVLLQFPAQFLEVVDFAVLRDPDTAVFVRHGHMPSGREVDDAQPAIAEANFGRGRAMQAMIIGSAMMQDFQHALQQLLVNESRGSANAAHLSGLSGSFRFQFRASQGEHVLVNCQSLSRHPLPVSEELYAPLPALYHLSTQLSIGQHPCDGIGYVTRILGIDVDRCIT